MYSNSALSVGVELTGKHRKLQWPRSGEEPEPDVTVRLELRQVSSLARSSFRSCLVLYVCRRA